MQDPEDLKNELRSLLDAHHEWILIDAAGRSFAVQKTELEIATERGRMLFGFLGEKGFQTWRVADFQTKAADILLNLTRNFGRERVRLRLVPRVSANDLNESIELARLEKANRLAALVAAQFPKIKLARAGLNKENGRFAQFVLEDLQKRQTFVLSDVSENLTPEILLSTAILRLVKLEKRKRHPVVAIWILGEKRPARKLQKLHALLRENWKSRIFIKEISREGAQENSGEAIKDLPVLQIADLWRGGRSREIERLETPLLSAAAQKIIEISPAEIDAVFSRHGETLRFNGLPFARVRRVLGKEKIWFGVENRQLLAEDNFEEFARLIESLRKFRTADSPNRRHAFYKLAPEAWLEAILRRNIRRLDANLILAPLYPQFRTERGRVDLLALRKDGRLVIIELKTDADREMVFQIAGYWRRLEFERRRGNLQKARLFGDLEIAAKPAVCYTVAPRLAFHRDFEFLAGTVVPEIEIHRFNLAENWRADLKVLDRFEVPKKSLV